MKKVAFAAFIVAVVIGTIKLLSMPLVFPYSVGYANIIVKSIICLIPVVAISGFVTLTSKSRIAESIAILSSLIGAVLGIVFYINFV